MAKKILIVDDEQLILMTMQDRLMLEGFDVVTAENGQDGMDMAVKEKPDLIVLDIMLPDMDGNDVCRILKSRSDFQSTIIIATSRIDAVDAFKARKAGADDFAVKGSDYAPIVTAVKKLLDK